MVQANPDTAVDDASEPMVATYDDFQLLETGDVDTFLIDFNELPTAPPYFIDVDGRRFALQRDTFLVRGHGATLPDWLREQDAADRLVLLAERGTRYLIYIHDPNAEEEDDD